MKLGHSNQKEKLRIVRPEFKVTGASFGGYGGRYHVEQKRKVVLEKAGQRQNGVEENDVVTVPQKNSAQGIPRRDEKHLNNSIRKDPVQEADEDSLKGYGKTVGAVRDGKRNHDRAVKPPAVPGVTVPQKNSAQGIPRRDEKHWNNSIRKDPVLETDEDSLKEYGKTVGAVRDGKRNHDRAVKPPAVPGVTVPQKNSAQGILGGDEKHWNNSIRKDPVLETDEDGSKEYEKTGGTVSTAEKVYLSAAALSEYKKAGQHQENRKRQALGAERPERDELIKRCRVRTKQVENTAGVLDRTGRAGSGVAENEEPEPWVCSPAERERRKQGIADKTERDGGEEKAEHKKRRHIDKVKRDLLIKFVVKEMVHEEGKRDPNAHFKLLKDFFVHDLKKFSAFIGKIILKMVLRLFLMLLPVLLVAAAIMIPAVAVYLYLINPISYYDNIYDMDQEIAADPLYLKNVVQEKCRDFAGEIQTIEDNWKHEVSYPYEDYPDADIVTIVYLAKLCTMENYKEAAVDSENGYPPYLLVDTDAEAALLDSVFSQLHYIESTPTEISTLNEEGEYVSVPGFDTKIYCLTLGWWKLGHENELSEQAKELLEELEEKIGKTGGVSGDFAGNAEAVPIEDLVIPEGVDENLIYLAGFIRAEAGNQPAIGKTAVAYVILNRAGGSSGNIKGVLLAPYQFSCYIPYHTVEQYLTAYASMTQAQREADACYQAASGAYYGTDANPIGDMKYYCNPRYCSAGETRQWEKIHAKNSAEEIMIIGDHVFCKNCW